MPRTISSQLGTLVSIFGSLFVGTQLVLSATTPLRLVSVADPLQVPTGGNGDSGAPILSADGRLVLFASTANNLSASNSAVSLSPGFPGNLNVFLRDRASNSITLVSANLSGGLGNDDSLPFGLSSDGRFALFQSRASDLVVGDTNKTSDLFVRDLLSNRTALVTVSTNGGFANGLSHSAVMTPDGRYVAFVSSANNLVPNDTNGVADIFVRDLQDKVTSLVTVGAKSLSAGNPATAASPLISSDGRYIAFYSTASNLVPGVPAVGNIYVRDLLNGTTTWASAGASNALYQVMLAVNSVSLNHGMSTDGQLVFYEADPVWSTQASRAILLRFSLLTAQTDIVYTNIPVANTIRGDDVHTIDVSPDGRFVAFVANTNILGATNRCILVWDAQTGGTALASANTNNTVSPGSICRQPVIDPTGRFVSFLSTATDLTTNSPAPGYHLYRRDLQTGATVPIDVDSQGLGSMLDPLAIPQMSDDGNVFAFQAFDGSLVPNDRNHFEDLFVRDLTRNGVELISARDTNLPSLSPNAPSVIRPGAASDDGRFVVFSSDADNLIPNDTNSLSDVFIRDLVAGTNGILSLATNGSLPNGMSTEPVISADGRLVAFTSSANNLADSDSNKNIDVFLLDRLTGLTSLISVSTNGFNSGDDASYLPILSPDNSYVLFRSKAHNLFAGAAPGSIENLVLRKPQTGTTYGLTLGGVTAAATSANGHFVVFFGAGVSASFSALYVWDSALNTRIYTNSAPLNAPSAVAISPDGNRLAYISVTQLYAIDRVANTNWMIGPANSAHSALTFSGDGRFLTYVGVPGGNTLKQIYVYDFQTGTNLLVTRGFNGVDAGDAASDLPSITADSAWITYHSTAGNLVPGDTNGWPDIFLYDRAGGATTLLSSSLQGGRSANVFSIQSFFTGNGRMLIFHSWASDLLEGDNNSVGDVFAYNLYDSTPLPDFSATITPAAAGAFWISWPVYPGKTYVVQFKDNLSDSQWQNVPGGIQILGSRGFLWVSAGSNTQRFYRVVGS